MPVLDLLVKVQATTMLPYVSTLLEEALLAIDRKHCSSVRVLKSRQNWLMVRHAWAAFIPYSYNC